MNTSAFLISIKRVAAVTAGIVLLSLCGQSIASAYQYPALTSHHKYRIFVTHKSASKAPVMAALRALPAKSSTTAANVLGTIDVYPALLSPATLPTDGGVPYITFGGATPTYAPQYTLPSHVVLTPVPTCSVVAGPGTLSVGTYTVDCLNGPASVTYDETGTQVDYTVVYHSTTLKVVAPLLTVWTLTAQPASYTIGGTVPTLSAVATDSGALSGSASCAVYANSDSSYSSSIGAISSLAVGNYTIHCTGSANAGYAAPTLVDATLSVTAAPSLTGWSLTAQNASYTIGGTIPTLTAVASPVGGLYGSAACGIYAANDTSHLTALGAISSLSAGSYAIHCTGTPATGYAVATLIDGVLTVSAPPPAGSITYVSHTVSYNLAGGNGTLPASIESVVGSGYTVASAYGITKDGYTFGGWTDGVNVYAAGSIQYIGNSDIVLTAIWKSTSDGSGNSDGSGAAQPIVLPKTPVTPPVAQVFTNHAVASNLVANFAKIVDITFKSTVVPVTHDAGTSLRLTDGVQASLLDQLNLVLTSSGVQVTAVKGWTGRISFPVVATQSGKDVELFVGVEEDPAPVLTPVFTLVTTKQAKISWTVNNSQVELYNVYLGNSLACTASKNTCTLPIKSISNFKSSLKIESVGHQATYSTRVAPAYSLKSLVSAGIVHFNVGSAALTNTAKKTLAALVVVLKQLGVTNVNLNGHADATGLDAVNKQLSVARANAVKAYLAKALPKLKFNGKGFSSSVPVKSNATASGRSDNRRVEVLVG